MTLTTPAWSHKLPEKTKECFAIVFHLSYEKCSKSIQQMWSQKSDVAEAKKILKKERQAEQSTLQHQVNTCPKNFTLQTHNICTAYISKQYKS